MVYIFTHPQPDDFGKQSVSGAEFGLNGEFVSSVGQQVVDGERGGVVRMNSHSLPVHLIATQPLEPQHILKRQSRVIGRQPGNRGGEMASGNRQVERSVRGRALRGIG